MERWFCTLRRRVGRLVRKTLSFSRCGLGSLTFGVATNRGICLFDERPSLLRVLEKYNFREIQTCNSPPNQLKTFS